MATIQQISPDATLPSTGRHVLVRLGDNDALERQGESFVYTIGRKMARNLFEAHVQRMISDAELLADQEKIELVFVTFDPQLGIS
ncbi:MAG: hypothetical protein ACM3OF_07355 [Gemmatimonas sp.]|jgi:hypothetical protein